MIGLLDIIFKIHVFASVEDGHQIPGNQKSMDDRAGNVSKKSLWQCAELALLSMEKILHHLGRIKPCMKNRINDLSTDLSAGAGFLPSTSFHYLESRELCKATFISMSQTQISYILPH